jgi:hypothetical protein
VREFAVEDLMDEGVTALNEAVTGSDEGTFDALFQCGPSKETVTLSFPTKSTVEEVISCASKHFGREFRAMSIFGQQLDSSHLFADYFEPDATFVLQILPESAAGTLLAECLSEVESLPLDVQAAKLLMAHSGKFTREVWEGAMGDAVPTLVLLELVNGAVCGGVAAVVWPKSCGSSADPTGASFVFSLRPKVARYALKSRSDRKALDDAGYLKKFGGDLQIWGDSGRCFSRGEEAYAGPRADGELIGANERQYVGIVRLEVWRL